LEGEFVAPTSLPALLDYLLRHPDACLLAGSTEFGLAVNKRFARPAHIAYLGKVAELRHIEVMPTAWRIGAAVPLDEIEPLLAAELPDVAEVLRRFGSPPIRAMATLGGNIANGSPIGDSLPCLMALGATLHLCSAKAVRTARTVALEDFYTGYKQNTLQAGELIEAIELPRRPASAGWRFRAHKISKRFDQDISAACVAMHWRDEAGVMRDVRIAFNGLAPCVSRAPKVEAVFEGRRAAEVSADAIDAALAASFTPLSDVRASARYRLLVARNLALSFIREDEAVAA
jgi:xanthine dehydrogenase small subunit